MYSTSKLNELARLHMGKYIWQRKKNKPELFRKKVYKVNGWKNLNAVLKKGNFHSHIIALSVPVCCGCAILSHADISQFIINSRNGVFDSPFKGVIFWQLFQKLGLDANYWVPGSRVSTKLHVVGVWKQGIMKIIISALTSLPLGGSWCCHDQTQVSPYIYLNYKHALDLQIYPMLYWLLFWSKQTINDVLS